LKADILKIVKPEKIAHVKESLSKLTGTMSLTEFKAIFSHRLDQLPQDSLLAAYCSLLEGQEYEADVAKVEQFFAQLII